MFGNYKILSIIPARGGSKGIKNKNLRKINGKPLIFYSIDASLKSKYIDCTYVSTDSQKICASSIKYGANVPCLRPSELATDKSRTIDCIVYLIDFLKQKSIFYDVLVLLQPTSPLRNAEDIDSAIETFFMHDQQSLLSVSKSDVNPLLIRKLNKGGKLSKLMQKTSTCRRQDLEPYYQVNGAIYINRVDEICNGLSFNDNYIGFVMNKNHSIDIDSKSDLQKARMLIKQQNRMR